MFINQFYDGPCLTQRLTYSDMPVIRACIKSAFFCGISADLHQIFADLGFSDHSE